MPNYDEAAKKRDPNSMLTYNTRGYLEDVQDGSAIPISVKFGTFLCPHCDKTHVNVFICHDGEDEPNLLVAFKMDAEQSEKMANEFINPCPIGHEHVTFVPKNGGH